MPDSSKAARKKRKKAPVPINPATNLPYSTGTMKMRLLKRPWTKWGAVRSLARWLLRP
jgi:hypothetical protein